MISVKDLTVRYGDKTVLDRLTLDLPEEGITLLSGESGVGKTTLLRVLAGLRAPDGGQVSLAGRWVLLFQEDRLFPGRTAREQVEAVLPKARRDRAGELLALVELEQDAAKLPGELSGGMARRVSLARCLGAGEALGAAGYLLDEPFAGVDPERAERILVRLRGLGRPIVLTGHGAELGAYCDHLVGL